MRLRSMIAGLAVTGLLVGVAFAADATTAKKASTDRAAAIEARRQARQEELKKRQEAMQARAQKNVPNRQGRQAKRIAHGVKNGSLTKPELDQLQQQQQAIKTTEESYRADGKLTRDEWTTLRDQLNAASRCIFAEKHDTDGKQMAVYRFGRNVFAKPEFLARLEDPNFTRADAKAIAKDFRTALELKRKLATDKLTDDERAKLQAQYDELLNKYFEVRDGK